MADDIFSSMRETMIAEIADEAAATAPYTGRAAFGAELMSVMATVPRHEFVPAELQPYAYLNRPLPIGFEKTLSQPYMVALMTDLVELHADSVVLEIGAGVGYQAAVAASLAKHVYTVEMIPELANAAERRLARLGYDNVLVRVGNGYYGWAEHGPFDAVIVTAACELIPPPLLGQLKPGGRMVVPTGIASSQSLTLVERSRTGQLSTRDILPVRFSELDDPGTVAGAA